MKYESTEPPMPQVAGVPARLAKRRLSRAKRRPRTRVRSDAYAQSLYIGDLLRQLRQQQRPLDRSKYSPDVCHAEGKR